MAKSIKYLDYKVIKDDEIVKSGRVPELLVFSGSHKNFDLGGIWLSRSLDTVTTLEITNGVKTVNSRSDRDKTEWLEYLDKLNSGEVEDHR